MMVMKHGDGKRKYSLFCLNEVNDGFEREKGKVNIEYVNKPHAHTDIEVKIEFIEYWNINFEYVESE